MISRRNLIALGAGAAGLAGAEMGAAQGDARDYLREAQPDRDSRMKWWREARFGMFVHWGVYSVPAGKYGEREIPGIGEWIQASAGIPHEEYAKFPPRFNPVRFDAREWVRVMKEAGMKYLVITSKHHDGFCMFNARQTAWDIVDGSPYGQDPLKALSRECRRAGIKFCTYYSILDWHHSSQMPDPAAPNPHRALASNVMKPGRKEEYLAYMTAQLEQLLREYDPQVLWFDGEWVNWWTEADGKALYNHLRSIKPGLIINNRIGKGRKGMEGLNKGAGYAGDFGTPEQQIPPSGLPGVDWESCMTMNDTWGFKSFDHNWKSATVLIRNLCDIASKGGNFLLNVGPTSEGEIPAPSVERLLAMGAWLRVNGESIYGTKASPFEKPLPWGRATRRPGRIYLIVFDWPGDGRLALPSTEFRSARLLAEPRKPLEIVRGAEETVIHLGKSPTDPVASVVRLDVD